MQTNLVISDTPSGQILKTQDGSPLVLKNTATGKTIRKKTLRVMGRPTTWGDKSFMGAWEVEGRIPGAKPLGRKFGSYQMRVEGNYLHVLKGHEQHVLNISKIAFHTFLNAILIEGVQNIRLPNTNKLFQFLDKAGVKHKDNLQELELKKGFLYIDASRNSISFFTSEGSGYTKTVSALAYRADSFTQNKITPTAYTITIDMGSEGDEWEMKNKKEWNRIQHILRMCPVAVPF